MIEAAVGAGGELAEAIKEEGIGQDVVRPIPKFSGHPDVIASLLEGSDEDDGSYVIILCDAVDDDESDDVPLGRTLGIDRLPRRFGARKAAVVFPKEIVRSFAKQNPNVEAPYTGHEEELAYRLRFTILHELGHLLNLPHPWQRDAFSQAQMTAEPAAATWMQYGSLFPLGAANAFPVDAHEDEDQRRELRHRLAAPHFRIGGKLREARFTEQERLHIFHAPYDRISAGGRTFIDGEREVRMQAADADLELVIEGAERNADGVMQVNLPRFANLGVNSAHMPPVGPRPNAPSPRPRSSTPTTRT
jgi:hypothetical protein